MAIWQLTTHLIPKQKLEEVFVYIPHSINHQVWNEVDWWCEINVFPSYETYLSAFLPENTSWDVSSRVWGREDSNIVKVSYEDDRIEEIMMRFDLRSLSEVLLDNSCKFAEVCKCLFLTEDMSLIEPNTFALKKALKRSKAFKFLKDPTSFLNTLSSSSVK